MKNIVKIIVISLLVLFVSLSMCFAGMRISDTAMASAAVSGRMTVVVDAGHGGIDPGAIAADGTFEKDINLAISKSLCDMLSAFGFNAVMTRIEDTLIGDNSLKTVKEKKRSDIKKRLEISESGQNSLLLSIHQNNFSQGKYSGTQVFYSKNNSESSVVAQLIQSDIARLLQKDNDRQIKPVGSEIYLLYHSKNPAVMVECGFISNQNELDALKTDEYQNKLSFCILNSVLQYKNGSELSY